MKAITCGNITLNFDENSLLFSFDKDQVKWRWAADYKPYLITADGNFYFQEAQTITHRNWKTGLGVGIISHYENFVKRGKSYSLAFETIVWIEEATQNVHFEFIPLIEDPLLINEVRWPGYMEFDQKKESHYTLLNEQQGLLIPNTWPEELKGISFDGHMCTAGSYMPWFGQVKEGAGYIAICEQPWNAGYYANHPANGPYTHVGIRFYPSLGKIDFRRTMCYSFLNDCDYNTLCKVYRQYVKEQGTFRSLKEKAIVAPVEKLIGSVFVHAGIKTEVQPDSNFFDPNEPDKNNRTVPFEQRTEEIRHYHDDLGIKKLYLHLDGWAQPGYDNQHPDYLPACEEAGGWEKMKELTDTIHNYNYTFGIHDQYRDYYFAAKTFDKNFGTRKADGTYPEHANWAGGHQTYLCATQAPYYVKRNFSEIIKQQIDLDCAYLDVFTCNEGDECSHPWHRMTRKECFDYRGQCFSYLLSKGILPSSEEVTDWSIPSLVFCHYAPYDFMMRKPGSPKYGLPVPLFNLVYHDCVIIPWMMEQYDHEDYMLYALLNGGAPYFIRNGAYQNTDGSFNDHKQLSEEEMVDRCNIVTKVHEQLAMQEMISHTFLNGNPMHQKTTFSDGTTVEVDFEKHTYHITKGN